MLYEDDPLSEEQRQLHGQLWQRLAQTHILLEQKNGSRLYDTMLRKSSASGDKISRDIARTVPNETFRVLLGVEKQKKLRNVLHVFSLLDAKTGYTQGINFVVGMLILHMEEEEALWTLIRIMQTYGLEPVFQASSPELHEILVAFDEELCWHFPDLHEHLQSKLGITSELYAVEYLTTLFTYVLSFEMVQLIWDVFFAEGRCVIFQFALGLISLLRPRLLKANLEGAMSLFKNTPSDITWEALSFSAMNFEIRNEKLSWTHKSRQERDVDEIRKWRIARKDLGIGEVTPLIEEDVKPRRTSGEPALKRQTMRTVDSKPLPMGDYGDD